MWSNAAWNAALTGDNLPDEAALHEWPVLGVDPARYGDDFTAIHVRCGGRSLAHERHNGWSAPQIVGRIKELCRHYAKWAAGRQQPGTAPCQPEDIRVNIDADGMGGLGVVDWGMGFQFCGIGAATAAHEPSRYPNRRSELWFALAERARRGLLDVSKLEPKTRQRLQQQLMAPLWTLDAQGRRVVESKADTKKRLSLGSPDDADAAILAYADSSWSAPEAVVPDQERRSFLPHEDSAQRRRGYYGRQ